MNRGTIYLHYTDKFDLLDKCVKEHLSNMLTFCTGAKPGEERFDFHFLLSMFQYFEANSLFYFSMLTNKGIPIPCFHDRLLLMIMHEMNERMTMGDMNRGTSNEIVVQFMASAFVGVVEWWIKNKMPHAPQFMAQQVWNIFEKSQFLSPPMSASHQLS
jgi:AcrR family transcriptional regulator